MNNFLKQTGADCCEPLSYQVIILASQDGAGLSNVDITEGRLTFIYLFRHTTTSTRLSVAILVKVKMGMS